MRNRFFENVAALNKKRLFTSSLAALLLLLILALSAAGLFSPLKPATAVDYPVTDEFFDLGYEIAPMEDNEFSLIVMGDTQYLSKDYPEFYTASTQWIVDNADDLNLEYVLHVGDVVDTNSIVQHDRAWDAMKILHDNDVRYSISMGNHDYQTRDYSNKVKTMFDDYYPVSNYSDWDSFGGTMNSDSIEYSYHFFNGGGKEYMIIALPYLPNEEGLEWANGICAQYPEKKVIVTTHAYIDTAPEYLHIGKRIWNSFVRKHANIQAVFCGHYGGPKDAIRRFEIGDHGNTVLEMEIDPQGHVYGGAGSIYIMRFRENGDIECNYYTPYFDKYFKSNAQEIYRIDTVMPTGHADTEVYTGKTDIGGINYNFEQYREGSVTWVNNTRETGGLKMMENGLAASAQDAGYMTFKISAGEGSMFKTFVIDAGAKLYDPDSTLDGSEGVYFYASTDGQNYNLIKAFFADHYNGYSALRYDASDRFAGCNEIFIKVLVKGKNMRFSEIRCQSTVYRHQDGDADTFSLHKEFNGIVNFDNSAWTAEAVEVYDVVAHTNVLGTGDSGTQYNKYYGGAEGHVIYKFEAAPGKKLNTLNFNATGKLGGKDMGWALRIYLSVDNKDYWLVKEEKVGGLTSFNYDLSEYAEGEQAVYLKLAMYGSDYAAVGLNEFTVSGTYSFDIDYVLNGGQNSALNPTSYLKGAGTITLADPTREGYKFGGWYLDEMFSGTAVTEIDKAAGGGKVLYAKWLGDTAVSLTYSLYGGTNSALNPVSIEKGGEVTLYAPVRLGYEFGGWYLNADFSGDAVTGITASGDMSLHAKWLKKFAVVFIGGAGSQNTVEYFAEGQTVSLAIPQRQGYEFLGWYSAADYSGAAVTEIAAGNSADVVLYAKWG